MLTRRDSEKGVMLSGITFHHPGAFWFGVIATIVGVAMHLPMYLMAKDMGYHLAGMPMDMGMTLGMGAIAVGLMASFWGVYPRAGQGVRNVSQIRAKALDDARISPTHIGLFRHGDRGDDRHHETDGARIRRAGNDDGIRA